MKLVNMQRNLTEPQETIQPTAFGGADKFPWELRITLDSESIDKLGLNVADIKVGTVMRIEAKAKVTEVRSIDREVEHPDSLLKNEDRSITLQVTDLGLADNDNFDMAFKEAEED